MDAKELDDLKREVVRNRQNLEFTTKINTHDLLRLIELAEKGNQSSLSVFRQESTRGVTSYTGESISWYRTLFRK